MNRRPGRSSMFAAVLLVGSIVSLGAQAAPSSERAAERAADRAASEEAREHFQKGESFFKLEKYKEALDQYEQGYLAKADASFLYNIAQCHRLMGDKAAALRFYRRFLSEATRVPNRPIVEQHIRDLEAALAAEPAAPPPSAPLPAAPEPIAPAAPVLVAQPPPAASPGDDQPIYKKWWFWTIVGAVAIGGGVGAYLATRSSSNCEAGRVCM